MVKDKEHSYNNGAAKASKEDKDAVAIEIDQPEGELLFKDMTPSQKCRSVTIVIIKLLCFLALLYIFICSLGLLESGFQLLGGKTAGKAFSSGILSNPLAGLMIGVLATVLVQSSSTSTSIVVTMVGSNIIPVENAVPIVMGANIGTSVTNTLVSLAQASNRDEFRRAFAGATVHDMFNWLSVIVLLPIEIAGGYLRRLTGLMVEDIQGNGDKAPDMLKAITKPLTDHVVEINKDIIKDIASKANDTSGDVLKRWCKSTPPTIHHTDVISVNCDTIPNTSPLRHVCDEVVKASSADKINVSMSVLWDSVLETNKTEHLKRCDNLFAQTDLDDSAAGAIILVISLVLLLLALFLIVKLLNSLLSGSVTKVIKKTINADFPGVFAYFTPYVALLVGCGMTMIVQSSSVFTSTLTPLVGLDIVSVERMYPMTLGSNVGTTITAILAALSQSPDHVQHALQIALCHLFFNISGIILFFPLPFMRWPITFAKILGKTTAKHRWFAIFYIIAMFIILPGAVFGLSLAGWIYLAAIGGPILLFFLLIVLINVLQRKFPRVLPTKLQNWNFLPEWCHSLKPVDRLIERVFRCNYCKKLQNASKEDDENSQETETEVSTDDVESFKKQNGISNNGGLAVMSHEDESLKDSKHFTDPKYGVTNQGFHGDTRM